LLTIQPWRWKVCVLPKRRWTLTTRRHIPKYQKHHSDILRLNVLLISLHLLYGETKFDTHKIQQITSLAQSAVSSTLLSIMVESKLMRGLVLRPGLPQVQLRNNISLIMNMDRCATGLFPLIAELAENMRRDQEMYTVLLPICTAATTVKKLKFLDTS
jgi:hypothetical protein